MALPRTLEPEVMDTPEEAHDYDAMDHAQVNARFCEDLLATAHRVGASLGRVLDVGTGTARIPIALCQRATRIEVEAIDLADHMLALAAQNVERAGLQSRIRVTRVDAKATPWPEGAFDAVVSNSIVHHIPEPPRVLAEAWRLVRPGGLLFVRDLERPAGAALLAALVDRHALVPDAAPALRAMHQRQRALFEASLHAALTVAEVRAYVVPLGIPSSAVETTSDRHWTLACMKACAPS
jgi:ubiquinone/menaquinone biosynthesis C-methylase UbiE